MQDHRRQQKRDVQQREPSPRRGLRQPFAGQSLRCRQEATHDARDQQRLDQHDAARQRNEHQAEDKDRTGKEVLPRIGFERAGQPQHVQIIVAPAPRPDDDQNDQRKDKVREHPLEPAQGERVLAPDVAHQRDGTMHHRKSQQQKQPLIDKEGRCMPVVAEKQPVGGQREQAPQHRGCGFCQQTFSRLQHRFSFHGPGAHRSASKPAAFAGDSAARYSSGVPKGRCRSVAKPRICAPRSASTL